MIKKALKFAIGPSLGMTLGAVIIPRMLSSTRHNEMALPMYMQAGIYFVVVYIVSFLVSLLIEWIRSRAKNN